MKRFIHRVSHWFRVAIWGGQDDRLGHANQGLITSWAVMHMQGLLGANMQKMSEAAMCCLSHSSFFPHLCASAVFSEVIVVGGYQKFSITTHGVAW